MWNKTKSNNSLLFKLNAVLQIYVHKKVLHRTQGPVRVTNSDLAASGNSYKDCKKKVNNKIITIKKYKKNFAYKSRRNPYTIALFLAMDWSNVDNNCATYY